MGVLSKCIILFASLSAPQIVKAAHGSYSNEDVRMLRNGAARHAQLCQTRRRRLAHVDSLFRLEDVVEAKWNNKWFLALVSRCSVSMSRYDLSVFTIDENHNEVVIRKNIPLPPSQIRTVFRKDEKVDVFTGSVWSQATIAEITPSWTTGRSYDVKFDDDGSIVLHLCPDKLRQVFEENEWVEVRYSRHGYSPTIKSAVVTNVEPDDKNGHSYDTFGYKKYDRKANESRVGDRKPDHLRKVFKEGEEVILYQFDKTTPAILSRWGMDGVPARVTKVKIRARDSRQYFENATRYEVETLHDGITHKSVWPHFLDRKV